MLPAVKTAGYFQPSRPGGTGAIVLGKRLKSCLDNCFAGWKRGKDTEMIPTRLERRQARLRIARYAERSGGAAAQALKCRVSVNKRKSPGRDG